MAEKGTEEDWYEFFAEMAKRRAALPEGFRIDEDGAAVNEKGERLIWNGLAGEWVPYALP